MQLPSYVVGFSRNSGRPIRFCEMVRNAQVEIDYGASFERSLKNLRSQKRYRVFADIERIAGRAPYALWHSPSGQREVVLWCSNDYLGMGQYPEVIEAAVETTTRVGVGAGGTRNIAGTNHSMIELERELADLHGSSPLSSSLLVTFQTRPEFRLSPSSSLIASYCPTR